MRRVMAMLGFALAVVVPAVATIETTNYDYGYQVSPQNQVSSVRIDWVKQVAVITTVEKAPSNAVSSNARAVTHALALASARKSAAALIKSMRLTAYATTSEVIATGYLPAAGMASAGKTIRPVAESWDSLQRQINLVSVLPFTGADSPYELAARMLTVEQEAFAKHLPVMHTPMQPKLYPSKAPVTQLSDGPYTGVVLDCTGIPFTPVLLPKLVAKDATELWGMQGVNPQIVMEKGLVGYAATSKDAIKSGRVGEHPYIIRPLGTCGPFNGDLVLSEEDAKQLADLQEKTGCLTNQSVVILSE